MSDLPDIKNYIKRKAVIPNLWIKTEFDLDEYMKDLQNFYNLTKKLKKSKEKVEIPIDSP